MNFLTEDGSIGRIEVISEANGADNKLNLRVCFLRVLKKIEISVSTLKR